MSADGLLDSLLSLLGIKRGIPVDLPPPVVPVPPPTPKPEGRAVLDLLPEVIIQTDPRLTIVSFNRAAQERFTNIRLGAPFATALRHPEVLGRLEKGEPGSLEILPVDPDGPILCAQLSRLPTTGWLVRIEDVTERYRLRRALAQAVSDAAHEFRTPLTILEGALETLEVLIEEHEWADGDVSMFLGDAQRAQHRLASLTQSLLTLSALERRDCPTQWTETTLSDWLRTSASILPGDDLHLTGGGQPIVVPQAPLETILGNFLQNARRYGNGGPIDIGIGDHPPGEDHPLGTERHLIEPGSGSGSLLYLWVQDQGDGIPLNALGRLGERFFRAERHRTREPEHEEREGHGLGLAMVREAVASIGGGWSVASQPGEGTRMTVCWRVTTAGNS